MSLPALAAALALSASPSVGDTVIVPVTSVADYGCFVKGPGWEGMIHVTDLSWAKVKGAGDHCVKGLALELKVLKVVAPGRIGLSRKALLADPWGLATQRYAPGTTARVRVTFVDEDGAYVELEPGVDGVIPLKEFGTGPFPHGRDFVDAKVVDVDRDSRRIRLTFLRAKGDAKANVVHAMKDVGEATARFNAQVDAVRPVVKQKRSPGEEAEALDWQAAILTEALGRLAAADGLTDDERRTVEAARKLVEPGVLPVELKRVEAVQASLKAVVGLFHVLELRFKPAEERRPTSRGH